MGENEGGRQKKTIFHHSHIFEVEPGNGNGKTMPYKSNILYGNITRLVDVTPCIKTQIIFSMTYYLRRANPATAKLRKRSSA